MAVEEKVGVVDVSVESQPELEKKAPKKSAKRRKKKGKPGKKDKVAERKESKAEKEEEEQPAVAAVAAFSLSDEETDAWRQQLSQVFARYLVMTKSFALVRPAFFLDHHQVIQASLQLLSASDSSPVNAEGVAAPLSFLLKFIRSELWSVTQKYYGVPESERQVLLGEQAVAEIAGRCSDEVTLPPISFDARVLLVHPEVHTDGLKALLEATAVENERKIDRLSFELNDAFTDHRRAIFGRMQPMQDTVAGVTAILTAWQQQAPSDADGPLKVTTVSFAVSKSRMQDHLPYLALIVTTSKAARNEQLLRLQTLRGWLGQSLLSVRLGSVDMKFCDADYLQERAEMLDGKAGRVSGFVNASDQDAVQWIPANLSVASRYVPMEFFEEVLATYKGLAGQVKNKEREEGEGEDELPTAEMVEAEMKYIKAVLQGWEKRKKVFQKTDKWTVKILQRHMAPSALKKQERKALEDRFIEYSLQRWAKEADFQGALKREVEELRQRLGLYAVLGMLDGEEAEAAKTLVTDLLEDDTRLSELREDYLPGLSGQQRRQMRLWRVTVVGREERQVPISDLTKEAAKAVLKVKKEQLKALKKEKKKAEAAVAKEEVAVLRAVTRDWSSRDDILATADVTRVAVPLVGGLAVNLTDGEAAAVEALQPPEPLVGKKATKLLKKCRAILKDAVLPAFDEQEDMVRAIEREARLPSVDEKAGGADFVPILSKAAVCISPESLAATIRSSPWNSRLVSSMWEQYLLCLLEAGAAADGESHAGEKLARAAAAMEQSVAPALEDGDGQRLLEVLGEHQEEIDAARKSQKERPRPEKAVVGDEAEEVAGLLLLSRGLAGTPAAGEVAASAVTGCELSFSCLERLQLLDFFAYAKEFRMQFNARMTKMKENLEMVPYGVSEEAVKFMCTFSFKSRHLDLLTPLTDVLTGLWEKIEAGGDTDVGGRMRLKELGILRTMDKWGGDLERLVRLLRLPLSEEDGVAGSADVTEHPLAQLLAAAVVSHRQLRQTYRSISKRIQEDDTYQSGDLLLAIWKKKQLTMQGNRPPATFNFLMSFTKYEHTAKIYRNVSKALGPVGEPRLSHMYREYHDSELAIEEIAYSHIFRLSVAPLVTDKAAISALSAKYGDGWGEEIQRRYHALEARLHATQGTLRHISNPISRVMGIGTAAVLPWTKKHRKAADFEKTRSELVVEGNEDLQMTCSEFAINATIACLLDLNEQLRKELDDEKLPEMIVTIPFPQKEKFSTMQPERLRQLLNKRKVLTQIEPPAFIAKLLA